MPFLNLFENIVSTVVGSTLDATEDIVGTFVPGPSNYEPRQLFDSDGNEAGTIDKDGNFTPSDS